MRKRIWILRKARTKTRGKASPPFCGKNWRKPTNAIADRAKRYRANEPECLPALPAECAICGSTRFLVVDDIDLSKIRSGIPLTNHFRKQANFRVADDSGAISHALQVMRKGKEGERIAGKRESATEEVAKNPLPIPLAPRAAEIPGPVVPPMD
jgi:hypothetical protein